MGLDMYLSACLHLSDSERAGSDNNEMFADVLTTVGAKPFVGGRFPSATVEVSVAYWRKANAIHQWFVNNVQDGEDNCGEYGVDYEALEELLEACRAVKANPEMAEELLPTQQGFFFGNTEYDEWYLSSIDSTIEQVGKALATVPEGWRFRYCSSW